VVSWLVLMCKGVEGRGKCTCEHGIESVDHVTFVLGPCYIVCFWGEETRYSVLLEGFIVGIDFWYGVDAAGLTLLLCY